MIHHMGLDDKGCACGMGKQNSTHVIQEVTCLSCVHEECNESLIIQRHLRKMLDHATWRRIAAWTRRDFLRIEESQKQESPPSPDGLVKIK